MTTGPLGNRLLAGLPRADFDVLSTYMTVSHFAQNTTLAEAGDEIDRVFFPLSGMISLVIVMGDGRSIETATVGKDGSFGAASAFGLYVSRIRAVVQVAMDAAVVPASHFRRLANHKSIRDMSIRDNEMLLAQARVTAGCNALHTVEQRFCRWMLQTAAITESDTITLTQEFLSQMLGVRRTSVTDVASKLQATGAISYSRGVILILDRSALEAKACECFETLQDQQAL